MRRHDANPILSAASLGFPANTVFNPGATVGPGGEVVLLVRVEDRRGLSSIHVARSPDGVSGWVVEATPLLAPDALHVSAQWGYEDARVSLAAEIGRYVITCTAYGPPGPCVFLATTEDFATLDFEMVATTPEDKNAAVLPRRIGGQWWMLHRPVVMVSGAADIWISRSEDLHSWHDPTPVMTRRPTGWWDSARIGIGPPPIEVTEGWLLLYHGVRNSANGPIYRVGAALLDREEPWRVLRRLDEWVMAPEASYERCGDVNNVVFPCGAIQRGDELYVYYGAADTVIGLAIGSIDELLAQLRSAG